VAPGAAPRLNPFRVNFRELYERHLARHSQYGINVLHLVAVVGMYLAWFALAVRVLGLVVSPANAPWLLLAILTPYFLALALNLPPRLLAAAAPCMAAPVAVFAVPPLPEGLARVPLWLMVPLTLAVAVGCHKFQLWSHKIYDRAGDMTEFNKKYKKGKALFALLAFYELPLLLNYLLFDRKSWSS